jgi:hypothetical protein
MSNSDYGTRTSRRAWFKSSYSNSSGSCVETCLTNCAVHVRDSKDRRFNSPIIAFPPDAWKEFLRALQLSFS